MYIVFTEPIALVMLMYTMLYRIGVVRVISRRTRLPEPDVTVFDPSAGCDSFCKRVKKSVKDILANMNDGLLSDSLQIYQLYII